MDGEVTAGADGGPAGAALEPGNSYMAEGTDISGAIALFSGSMAAGFQGLMISRQRADQLRDRHGLDPAEFIWLTTNIDPGGEGVLKVAPTAVAKLSQQITSFLEKNEKCVVLLTGVEYLGTQNGFKSVTNLIYLLNDKIMAGDHILIVSLNPEAFSTREVNILRSELRSFP